MGILLRNRGFGSLWLGQLLSQMGNAVFLVMGLWEIQLRAPFLLSVAGLAMTLPQVLGAAGGVLVDRWDAGRLMFWTDALRGSAVAAGIVALTVPGGLVPDVIVLLGLNSLGGALFGPAEMVVIPRLVAERELAAANGMYNLTFQVSQAVGYAIGGASVAAIGVGLVFGLDMASFWLSALAVLLMLRTAGAAVRNPRPGGARENVPFLASMRQGLDALRAIPFMRTVPFAVAANFAFAAAFTMLPFWVRHVLHAGSLSYGLIDAAWAAGLVVGGLSAGAFGRGSLRRATALASIVQALLVGAFAASGSLALSAPVFLLAGVANGIENALMFTLLQRLIPDSLRGRAFGVLVSLVTLANPLGTIAAGATLGLLPLFWSWALAAFTMLGVAVAAWTALPAELSADVERSAHPAE